MSTIICSESGIDLKDKKSLDPCLEGLRIVDEKTIADIVKNSQTFLANNNVTNITSITPVDSNYGYQKSLVGYKDLGEHWVLANEATKKIIKEGNSNYIFYKQDNDNYIVLVHIKKDLYDDGSYKTLYNPLTLSTIKRMPE